MNPNAIFIYFGVGMAGYFIANFSHFTWSLDSVIWVHKWGFVAAAAIFSFYIAKFFLDSEDRAKEIARDLYDKQKDKLEKWSKKLSRRDETINELYLKQKESQVILENEVRIAAQKNREWSQKLIQIEDVLTELDEIKGRLSKDSNLDGRKKRELKKLDKIAEKAEALKEEMENENCES